MATPLQARPVSLTSKLSFEDVTDRLRAVSAALPSGAMVHGDTFDLGAVMNIIELMDPKLDPGATKTETVSVLDRLRSGALTLAPSATHVNAVMAKLLELESSFRSGNALIQTVCQCAYAHAHALAAMRHVLGLPHLPRWPDADLVDLASISLELAAPREKLLVDVPDLSAFKPLDAHAHAQQSDAACTYALTYALYGFCLSVLKSCGISLGVVMAAGVYEDEDVITSTYGADVAGGATVKDVMTALLSAEAAVMTALGADGAGTALRRVLAEPPSHTHTHTHTHTSAWCSHAPDVLGRIDEARIDQELLTVLRFLRLRRAYLCAQVHLHVDASSPSSAPMTAGRVFDVRAANDAVVGAAGQLLQLSTASCVTADTLPDSAAEAFSEELSKALLAGSQPTRFAPLPGRVQAVAEFHAHLAHLQYICFLPNLSSYNPYHAWRPAASPPGAQAPASACSTVAVPELTRFAEAWQPDSLAVVALWPPESGEVDPPVHWPDGAPADAPRRRHVSLFGLVELLVDFTKRGVDVYARSVLALMLSQMPPPPPQRVLAEGEDELTDYASSYRYSVVVFGSHTMQELIRSSMRDLGIHEEQLMSVEGQRLVYMLDKPVDAYLKGWCSSRARLRRRMDGFFTFWSFAVNECDALDEYYGRGLGLRLMAADDAFVACVAQKEALPRKAAAKVTRTDGLTDEDHAQLAVLHATSPFCRMLSWAMQLAMRLILTHLEIGFESALYHPDELPAVYYTWDYMLAHALRHTQSIEVARAVYASLPECRRLCKYPGVESDHSLLQPLQASPTDAADGGVEGAAASEPAAKPAEKRKDKKSDRKNEAAHIVTGKSALADARSEWLAAPEAIVQAARMPPVPYTRHAELLTCVQCLCRGMFRMTSALKLTGALGLPADGSTLHKPELVYAHRFNIYTMFSLPKPLPFEEYQQACCAGAREQTTVATQLHEADAELQHARVYAAHIALHTKGCLAGDEATLQLRAPAITAASAPVICRTRAARQDAIMARGSPTLADALKAQDPAPCSAFTVLLCRRDAALARKMLMSAVGNAAVAQGLLRARKVFADLPRDEPAPAAATRIQQVELQPSDLPAFPIIKAPAYV